MTVMKPLPDSTSSLHVDEALQGWQPKDLTHIWQHYQAIASTTSMRVSHGWQRGLLMKLFEGKHVNSDLRSEG